MSNPLLSARFYKTCPHLLFPDADWTVWIDANVFLHKPVNYFVQRCLYEGGNYGLFAHYFRNNAFEEFNAELAAKFEDNPTRLTRTIQRYSQSFSGSHYLSQNFLFVRRNSLANEVRNARWWQEICWGSRRDQLSLELFYPGPYWPTFDFTKPNEFLTRISP
jgi:hypothetical protein